jgi:hypothetical protein
MNEEYGAMPRHLYLPYLKSNAIRKMHMNDQMGIPVYVSKEQ